MRRTTILCGLALLGSSTVSAQKVERYDFTQARALDVEAAAYVKPQIADLKILFPKRQKFVCELTAEEVQSMGGMVDAMRSRATFDACEKFDCDVIVASTFRVRNHPDQKKFPGGSMVEVIGFPANYVNWHAITTADTEWFRIEKTGKTSTAEKTSAVKK